MILKQNKNNEKIIVVILIYEWLKSNKLNNHFKLMKKKQNSNWTSSIERDSYKNVHYVASDSTWLNRNSTE